MFRRKAEECWEHLIHEAQFSIKTNGIVSRRKSDFINSSGNINVLGQTLERKLLAIFNSAVSQRRLLRSHVLR